MSHYQNFTPPFPIPDSWQWVKLEDIITIRSGENIVVRNLKDSDIFPVYGGNGINGYYEKANVEVDTLIIGRVWGSIAEASHRNENLKAWITDNALIVTTFANHLNIDWLQMALMWANIRDTSNSTAQPVVSGKSIYPIVVPLPPLEEQVQIANKFKSFEVCISQLSQEIDDLIDYVNTTKSKILELAMQGKLVPQDPTDEPAADMLRRVNPKAKIITDNPHYPQLPDNWVYLSLSDINTYKSSTVTPANMPEQLFDLYSVPIFSTLTPENIHGGEIGSAKQVINKGDVLLCKINPHLNRVWEIIEDSHNVQIASSEWIVVRSELHHPSFLKWYFNSPEFRALLSSQVSGVGGSLTRAQPAIVKGYLVPVPPMEEQARISKAIEHWFECLDSIISGLSN